MTALPATDALRNAANQGVGQQLLEDLVQHVRERATPATISGLTLSNNGADATNDIDVAAGSARADGTHVNLVLGAAITKRLDAAWAVGTNQGGLDTGAVANGTYHVWLIGRSDTGVVDALFSLSATAPTMPANYDLKRRIGSIIRAGGTILLFKQFGDVFRWATNVTDRNDTAGVASSLLTVTVPSGIVVFPLLRIIQFIGVSCNVRVDLGGASQGATNTPVMQAVTGAGDTNDYVTCVPPPIFDTNTSAQIYHQQLNNVGTPITSQVITYGWVDRRGQDS